MELMVPSWGLIIFSVLTLALLLLWVIALWDVLQSQFAGANDKLIWVLVVLFAPVVGIVFYFIAGRKNKIN